MFLLRQLCRTEECRVWIRPKIVCPKLILLCPVLVARSLIISDQNFQTFPFICFGLLHHKNRQFFAVVRDSQFTHCDLPHYFQGNAAVMLTATSTHGFYKVQLQRDKRTSANCSIYRVSRGKCARLRENVPYVKVHRYNPKHLYPKLNGYGNNGERSLKV